MNIAVSSDPFVIQASTFKALAHPVRLQILTVLRQGEACVCHLEAILQRRQAYISQQLTVLKEAGLLVERKEGLFVFYSLADENLPAILDGSWRTMAPDISAKTPLSFLPSAVCTCPHCAESQPLINMGGD